MSSPKSAPKRPGVSHVLRESELPAPMLAALEAAGVPRGGALAAFPADMSAEGGFVDRWLVICRDRLAVLDGPRDAEHFELLLEERYAGLNAIEYRGMVGGGIVLVRRGDEQREMVRCSRAADRAIQAALAKLRGHLELEKPAKPEEKGKEKEEGERREKPAPDAEEGGEKKEEEKEEPPPPEALPEIPGEEVKVFLGQLDELGEQRYCATCGLPFKQDSSVCPQCVQRRRTLWRVLKLAWPYKYKLLLLCVLLASMIPAQMIPPYILGKLMFDWVLRPVVPTDSHVRVRLLLILLAISFLSHATHFLIRVFQGRLAVGVGASVSRDLREKLFTHLQTLSLGYFDRHKTGALMSRVSGDTRMLQGFLVDGVQWTIISILQVIVVSVILFSIHWRMALILMLTAPLMIIFTKTIWRRIISLFRRLWEVVSRMSAT
ncbi:MAG: ABC transporter transmembrane domain-containing protein, partial [Planctomycetota bacterium]